MSDPPVSRRSAQIYIVQTHLKSPRDRLRTHKLKHYRNGKLNIVFTPHPPPKKKRPPSTRRKMYPHISGFPSSSLRNNTPERFEYQLNIPPERMISDILQIEFNLFLHYHLDIISLRIIGLLHKFILIAKLD